MTPDQVKKVQDEVKRELKIDKTELSTAKRKLISAEDARASSQAIGWLGGLILGLIVAPIIAADVHSLFHFVKMG